VARGVHFHLVHRVWEASIKHNGLIPFVNPTEGIIYSMAKVVRLKKQVTYSWPEAIQDSIHWKQSHGLSETTVKAVVAYF